MSYNINDLFVARNSRSGYQIEQSLRFDRVANSYLSNTPSSEGNRRTYTISMWVKTSLLGSTNRLMGVYAGTSDYEEIQIDSGGNINWYHWGGSYSFRYITNAKLRDPSAWYHFVFVSDTTNATPNDRHKIYINGVDQTFSTRTNPSQNFQAAWNRTQSNTLGTLLYNNSPGNTLDGYMAEVYHVDGTALEASDFGEYDDNGVWRPIEPSGLTYGTNGFYFDFSNSSDLGEDQAGSNDWTANSFTTSGTGTDVMSDTPTNNFATWNPIVAPYSGTPTYSEGNLKFSLSDGPSTISTLGVISGKWYCEIKTEGDMADRPIIGLNYINPTSQQEAGDRVWPGWDVGYAYSGVKWVSYSSSSYGSSWSSGDIIGIALDLDSGTQTVTFYLNGTSQGSINLPVSGKTWHVSASSYGADGDNLQFTANFGQRDFEYTQPSGYNSWCTANLPAPDIADGSDYFNTVLWTGTSAENPISTVGFQPDFTWIKGRDNSTNHVLADAVRGATKVIESDSDVVEYTDAQSVKSFDTNGFTLGTSNDVNNSTAGYNQYVAWNWLAGGSGSTNTDGTLSNTVTVSANPSAGFSIVTYTGDGVSNATVGHGLGVVPALVISKVLSGSTGPWYVKHKNLASGKNIYLNWTDAETSLTSGGGIGDLNSSTTFTCANGSSNNGNTNSSGRGYVTYCFAEVENYSKFGSYTGNDSSNGPFVYCGFRPAWVLVKRTDSTGSWALVDSSRSSYNVADDVLFPNTSGSESTSDTAIDLLSNGFKLRSAQRNFSGATYIFAAFAEHPLGGDGVSPATAR